MMNLLKRYWNFNFLGIPKAFFIVFKVSLLSFYEKISGIFWKFNLKECGKGIVIQKGALLRFPGNISIKNNVSIGRNTQIDSEFSDSILVIDNNTQINKLCNIDFSGNLIIGRNVLVSENVTIMTHNHGYDPHSIPQRIKKVIGDNVWIGSHSIILPKVESIGNNSIIASGSIVTKNVPEDSIVVGNPARIISSVKK